MNGPSPATADTTQRIVYEFVRATTINGWWLWALLIVCVVLVLGGCVRFYRRDTAELPSATRWTLMALRVTAILGLLFFLFDLQRRTQREITRPSEVVVLVDTSQSMSLAESDRVGSVSRAERAAELLGQESLSEKLSALHRVSVYSFGESAEPVLLETRSEQKFAAEEPEQAADSEVGIVVEDESAISVVSASGALVLVLAILLGVASLIYGAGTRRSTASERSDGPAGNPTTGKLLLATAITLIVGSVLVAIGYCNETERTLLSLLGGPSADPSSEIVEEVEEADSESFEVLDWSEAVVAAASQSRIGDAITSILASHDPTTLAGIILVTDGQNNGGNSIPSATATARRSEVAVYPIGLGSSEPPTNVRIVDLDAPRRVYPNDKFFVSAVLQSTGGKPMEIEVQLLDGLDNETTAGQEDLPAEVVDSQKIRLAGDGGLEDIKFELEPESVGRRRLALRLVAPPQDQNENDNVRDARYEVVARKLRVMTIAGGPTREYRFVRNLLFREPSIRLDTWLQSGQPGMSQDADSLITDFPATAAELFEYDAIVMFDPDWTKIPAESIELLDRWVSSQAGGLLIVGGPVFHQRWLRLRTDPRVSKIAGFFPVTFSNRGLVVRTGRDGGENAWPLDFTPEARRAEFLWVTDEPGESFVAWESFGGVFDYVGVKSAKPAAKVYAYFSDPTTRVGDTLPVYLASQFYGAGRVFFQGSGEMWRMRRESDSFFDAYYTKLIRWVSEGRLLRDSNRGVLLVDNPRAMVGDTITVRAVLTDEQFEPLTVPEVKTKMLTPGGTIEDVRLTPAEGEAKPGTYSGRFVVRAAGNHELRLTLGDGLAEILLRQNVQVRLPTIELERPRRNDEQLSAIASLTGGSYWALGDDLSNSGLMQQIEKTVRPQPQVTILPGTPDPKFAERRNASLLWLLASVLTMEWVVRRLHRLA
ncbi:MAG: VWA domain-containing protein [Planctomycetota bacterium]